MYNGNSRLLNDVANRGLTRRPNEPKAQRMNWFALIAVLLCYIYPTHGAELASDFYSDINGLSIALGLDHICVLEVSSH